MKLRQVFDLYPSRTQILIVLACHAAAAVALLGWFEPGWMRALALTLIGLLALRDYRQLRAAGRQRLLLDSASGSAMIERGEQTYFYAKYKVYACRWFAILRLMDKRLATTLILDPDCLDSVQSYRRLRYTLLGPETDGAA